MLEGGEEGVHFGERGAVGNLHSLDSCDTAREFLLEREGRYGQFNFIE